MKFLTVKKDRFLTMDAIKFGIIVHEYILEFIESFFYGMNLFISAMGHIIFVSNMGRAMNWS